jgi:hypothetical protein
MAQKSPTHGKGAQRGPARRAEFSAGRAGATGASVNGKPVSNGARRTSRDFAGRPVAGTSIAQLSSAALRDLGRLAGSKALAASLDAGVAVPFLNEAGDLEFVALAEASPKPR